MNDDLICFVGDLHFGEKGNSEKYNNSLLTLCGFIVEESKSRGCSKLFQFGDWHHDRLKINVDTLNKSVEGAKIFSEYFTEAYTIVSNHDIFYRDRLDVSSMKILEPYITVIDKPTKLFDDKVIAVPWVVDGQMWDDVVEMSKSCEYMFAHLELNGFNVNDAYVMEHGHSHVALKHLKKVYTGHYHSPQVKDNIVYCGTPIPITMNEANEKHGIYFFNLKTGDCEFVEYNGVTVVSIPYDKLDEVLATCDPSNSYIRVEFPEDLEDELLISAAQDKLQAANVSEFKIQYVPIAVREILNSDVEDVSDVENIDGVVMQFIDSANSLAAVDNDLLKEIYKLAIERSHD
ncbi:recombination-related endonuclease [Alishewanella phage vB_AspM_Slickus01]|nr:recombination-related endonuclease [Alishewanella phage vB_AspM_Slicko01]WGH49898.1 recombination-related endonuclease [Alishewanella phage vB_AspM_Slickus01]